LTSPPPPAVRWSKIGDIFAHRGTGRILKWDDNNALFNRTLEGFASLADGGLLFANFIDFDTIYGHCRDVAGYAAALEAFDRRLSDLLPRLNSDDRSDMARHRPHARADPRADGRWQSCSRDRGAHASFADVGASVASHLDIGAVADARSRAARFTSAINLC
jgi:phosphopentomutase